MFGWDYHNSKSDRIKLFLFILVVFLIVGFTVTTILRSINHSGNNVIEAKTTAESTKKVDSDPATFGNSESAVGENEKNKYDQTEHFSDEQLEKTKNIAIHFTTAFHTYNADQPMHDLENAKPYMTEALYEKMKRTMRREPLDRSYLTVKETEVTPVVNSSSLVVRWNVIVIGEAKSVDGSTKETEDWYLVSLRDVNGEWKVEDVRTNVPN